MSESRVDHLPIDCVVRLTPEGRGAVASLCVDGPRALELVERHFRIATRPLAIGRIHIGHWGTAPAEEVVVCRVGLERIEVHGHGGAAASRRIVADLVQDGCRELAWREWIELRESNHVRVAARALLAEARTERTAAILLDQFNGALDQAIGGIIAMLEAGDVENGKARLDEILARAAVGLHLVVPWRVVLAGPPNVGKSSLINALAGYRRAIVHDRPGTTRDPVNASAAFNGWPVELIDTAGLRISDDPLEAAGIELARRHLTTADAVILVFDAALPWNADLAAMAARFPGAIVIHNKIDLLHLAEGSESRAACADRPPGIATSALTGGGMANLTEALVQRLVRNEPPVGAAVPFTANHVARLSEARDRVDRGDLIAALAALRAAGIRG